MPSMEQDDINGELEEAASRNLVVLCVYVVISLKQHFKF